MDRTARVLFTPSGRQGDVALGTTILAAAWELGVDLDSICGGRGICGRCQVSQGAGRGIPLDPTRLSLPDATEADYRARRPMGRGRRLGCAARIRGDVVIDVPPESHLHRQVVRKRPELVSREVDPVVRLYYVVTAGIDQHGVDAAALIRQALLDQWDLDLIQVGESARAQLPEVLDQGRGAVTVAVHDGSDVTGVWPGYRDVTLGVAFDVGSTTIAGHLCDLGSGEVLGTAGAMNPQIRFGEDVMSRVSYAMMHPGGAAELTSLVRRALDDLAGVLVEEHGANRGDILEVCLVGNPIMHHLFLGLDPTPLGSAPFPLATTGAVRIRAADLGIAVHPGARVYVPPCVAGHVGADAAAAILAEAPHRTEATRLLVDVGTNAEIVLGNSGRLLAASSPTGPAFEGAQITSGQRATPGAIERVRVDRNTFDTRIKVVGSDLWSDQSGFREEVAGTGITGICGSGIIEAIAELFLAGVITPDGTLRGDIATERVVPADRTHSFVLWDGPPPIVITQADVRAVQLAKAALDAGVRLLMDHLEVATVDEIRLVGAFGTNIDPLYAMVLGMIPDCDLERVSAGGNAAGAGAILALLSGAARTEIESVVTTIEKIETATEPGFHERFVTAMPIPHASARYPHLAEKIDLPPRPAAAGGARDRRVRSRNTPSGSDR